MIRIIKNFDSLAETDARRDALSIVEAGYAAIDVEAAILREVRTMGGMLCIGERTCSSSSAGRIFFIGIGKCAIAAARAVETALGERLAGGIALDVSPLKEHGLQKIEAFIGTHPLPTQVNMDATKRIVEFLTGLTAQDVVIMLISGGGSTLLCMHNEAMTCLDESILLSELTRQGASIEKINTVRKHISEARGGGLAKAAYPAEVIALIVSDVPGNNASFIASGPTVKDTTSVADAKRILADYGVSDERIIFHETPKEDKYFERVQNILFLTNKNALNGMAAEVSQRGYHATIVNDRFFGEAAELGRAIAAKLHDAPPRSAFLYGGETAVTLGTNPKKGGRSQELALAALDDLKDDELIAAFASDGRDNTEYAGAIADAATARHAHEKNLVALGYLATHGTYDFFTGTGDFILTGYTGSNVSDLVVALKI